MSSREDLDRVLDGGIVAIIRAPSGEQLVDVARALHAGGIDVIEVTFTVPGVLDIIRETREALVGLLDDPYHAMRRKAAAACGTYTVREARAGLEKLRKHDQHWSVRHAAGKALESLNK